LIIEHVDGKSQEYQFEKEADLRAAQAYLPSFLGDRLDMRVGK
jgi:hypothetical protein